MGIPLILAEVAPMMSNPSFMALANAAMDVVVSSSFGSPEAVVQVVSWPGVAGWLAESMEDGRPLWLNQDNLTVLACGLCAANILALPTAADASEQELHGREQLRERLSSSSFLEFFVLAMDAAVTQREWPAHSGAFHSVGRLTLVASVIANLGFRRQ